MTTVFSSKIDALAATVTAVGDTDYHALAVALQACCDLPTIAVGSGGSTISAEFLAACRNSLGHAPTMVITPMAYVLEAACSSKLPTWLFSASGENADILAAYNFACNEGSPSIDIVTSGSNGALAQTARLRCEAGMQTRLHIAPVSDPKDGFLATHSVIAAAASLVLGADIIAGSDVERRKSLLAEDVARCLSHERRADMRESLSALRDRDTLFILHDPHLMAAAVLIETSFWEAGICAVQRTDFRNFAHGRHVWLARHPGRTLVLAMTCERSLSVWEAIAGEMPDEIPRTHFNFGRPGRGSLFESLLVSLSLVEAAGEIKGVDPGRPGVANFGRVIFDQASLDSLARREDSSTRRKRRAALRMDPPNREAIDWPAERDRVVSQISATEIQAIVLDYDGTVVTTPERTAPPRSDITAALVTLVESGIVLGFATGRGGSVGSILRRHLPSHLHPQILVGYYNGAHIASLDVDIEQLKPKPDPTIQSFCEDLVAQSDLFVEDWSPKQGCLQVTIPLDKLSLPDQGIARIAEMIGKCNNDLKCDADGLKLLRSGHSIDVVPKWASKLNVVSEVRKVLSDDTAAVLKIGDRGDSCGNDFELLQGFLGLSVDRVCHRSNSGWNLLPTGINGPEGLVLILRSLSVLRPGRARIDISSLIGI